jgi:predicted  nucleic acid-binding Zn-ribbon protein
MQLHAARLCFNCEEVHDQPACPACGSDSFAYLSRWIPASERPARVRERPSRETAETYRQLLEGTPETSGKKRWMKRGIVGLAAISMAGWAWRRSAAGGSEASESTAATVPSDRPQKARPDR